ncbi:hypothetical protein DEJ45_02250 [Streptomyces venezuelae]|uniref:RNA polymerase factor sigma-54 n=1 Tax=Streptomyces venezuelae TaxID=54571 RepID=UPI00123D0139|nr:hypothetical protein [Streptomyces venezuelae]QES11353.1 hypothetical protein DEJ45_02250 [Streptomyces venezuelae]
MAAGMELRPAPVMAAHTSPALVAFASFLQLPALDLEARVAEELAANPALEEDPAPPACPLCGAPLVPPGTCPCWYGSARAPERPGPDRTAAERPGAAASPEPPVDDRAAWLLAEIAAELPAADAPLAAYLVGSLGPRGRLDGSAEEIAAALGVPAARVRRALAALRAAAPPGSAACDLRECLLLQLDRWEERHGTPEPSVRSVLTGHLEALADEACFPAAAAALGVPVGEIRRVRAFVRAELRPSPGLDLAPPPATACAPPDLVITPASDGDGTDGAYTVTLLEPLRLRLSVSPSYLACLAAPSAPGEAPAGERLARAQVGRAREFLCRLDRRWRTLHRIAAYIVDAQQPFLDAGPAELRPLCRREVAGALGLHESTVSRAVAGRVALLPHGGRTMPLAGFFGAPTGVGTVLRDLVERESRPLSDTELARLLTERGFPVARRTVAKYRAGLGIEPHARRAAHRPAA